VFRLLLSLSLAQPPSGGVVIPVYRDLLTAAPWVETAHQDRCGPGAGPLTILRSGTPKETAAAIARQLDAADVTGAAERALARASDALPGARVTVCLYPGELTGGLPYLGGVGGLSLGGGRIKLLLHPQPGGLARVPYTVAHEYHHEVERLAGPGGYGPIDILVREGKADHFAVTLYPGLRPPHTRALSDAELKTAWARLLGYDREQAPPSRFRADFMIGDNPRVTAWPGYRLAYEMVALYFQGRTPAPIDVVRTPARVIVDHYRRHGRAQRDGPSSRSRESW
jgi:uncharacterized protein YjaZ